MTVTWPTSKTTQTFAGLKPDQSLEITEGTDSVKILPRNPLAQPRR